MRHKAEGASLFRPTGLSNKLRRQMDSRLRGNDAEVVLKASPEAAPILAPQACNATSKAGYATWLTHPKCHRESHALLWDKLPCGDLDFQLTLKSEIASSRSLLAMTVKYHCPTQVCISLKRRKSHQRYFLPDDPSIRR